jgi:hypothetical protein
MFQNILKAIPANITYFTLAIQSISIHLAYFILHQPNKEGAVLVIKLMREVLIYWLKNIT